MFRNKPNTKNPRCEICGTKENVTLGPDPYSVEINDDHKPRHLCTDCRNMRRDEV